MAYNAINDVKRWKELNKEMKEFKKEKDIYLKTSDILNLMEYDYRVKTEILTKKRMNQLIDSISGEKK